jgi:hypothetical protein
VIRHALRLLGRAIALVALPASLLVAAPVAARTLVDPNTLNPAPPDFFNATCYAGAAGTICDLAFVDPESPWIDQPSGILCGSTELLVSQTRSVVGKRFYDADGNLLQRHFREFLDGSLTNPVTGRSVLWTQHDTVLHNLTIPGDLDSGVTSFTGLYSRFYLPGGATIQMDAGTFSQDVNGLVFEAGPHPLNDYFVHGDESAFQPVCDAVS